MTIGVNRNEQVAALAIAAAGTTTIDRSNHNARGLHLVIDITAIAGTSPTLTFTIQGYDPISGKYYDILASTALNSTGTTVLKVYPGLTAAANAAANDILPRNWRLKVVAGGTSPTATATVAANYVY